MLNGSIPPKGYWFFVFALCFILTIVLWHGHYTSSEQTPEEKLVEVTQSRTKAEMPYMFQDAKVSTWEAWEGAGSKTAVFRVYQAPKPIQDLPMGRVLMQREHDGSIFSAIIIPYRDIHVGTEMKLRIVTYRHSRLADERWFVIATEATPINPSPAPS